VDMFTCILFCTLFLHSVTFCIYLFFVLLTGLPLNAEGLLYHLLSQHTILMCGFDMRSCVADILSFSAKFFVVINSL